MISTFGDDETECCLVAARDWDEKGNASTVCPDVGLCGASKRALFGCPYAGLRRKGTGVTGTCGGWYRKQPLFLEMMRAVRLKEFWTNTTPDDLPHPLSEFFFWYSVHSSSRSASEE